MSRALLIPLAAVLYAVGWTSGKVRSGVAWLAGAIRAGYLDAIAPKAEVLEEDLVPTGGAELAEIGVPRRPAA